MLDVKYPLKVSDNKRYLIDQRGLPFLLQGDAAWSIIVALTKEETELYLKDRSEKGFNTILVNLIEHKFCKSPPKNAYGEEPFEKPGDFSTPNEEYFAHVDWVIREATKYGIQILLAPIYLGYEGGDEGWFKELLMLNLEKCLEYGSYLGKRYKHFDNIIWVMGGDRNPGPALERIDIIALGIKEHDKKHLFTAHCHPENSAVDQYFNSGWLDLNTTYTYSIVHRQLLRDYNRKPIMPYILIESTYEGEHNATAVQIRRQAYWSILCGGCGHVFGNRPIWFFGEGWQDALNFQGSFAMMNWGKLFNSIKWYDLIPDQKHEIVIEGLGEFNGLDYLSAAQTSDGSTIIAYMPTSRTITVDLSRMSCNEANVWWYNPQTGNISFAEKIQTKGLRKFTPPKEGDWVIIINDESKESLHPRTFTI
jgi:hypothetical protein